MEPSGRNRDYSEINPIRREIFMSWDGNSKSISEWKGLKRVSAHFIPTAAERQKVNVVLIISIT